MSFLAKSSKFYRAFQEASFHSGIFDNMVILIFVVFLLWQLFCFLHERFVQGNNQSENDENRLVESQINKETINRPERIRDSRACPGSIGMSQSLEDIKNAKSQQPEGDIVSMRTFSQSTHISLWQGEGKSPYRMDPTALENQNHHSDIQSRWQSDRKSLDRRDPTILEDQHIHMGAGSFGSFQFGEPALKWLFRLPNGSFLT